MGFKKQTKSESEKAFVNSARGETSTNKIVKEKRDKTFLVYFTENELDQVKQKAANLGMGINQYIRFKIFSNM